MQGSVLITDTLFVGPKQLAMLEAEGLSVQRLEVLKATEDQLVEAIKGKVGYILGGIETVTEPVIAAGDKLEVIAFTGSGYSEFIPAHACATSKGVAITAARAGNAASVAEFTLTQILAAVRQTPALTQSGGVAFRTTHEFSSRTIGIIGYGAIGQHVARLCAMLGFRVLANSRHETDTSSEACKIVSLDQLLTESDVVTVHVSKSHGHHVLGRKELGKLRKGTAVVNCAFVEAIDPIPLMELISRGDLRAIYDAPPEHVPAGLPPGGFVASNAQTAFNTAEANDRVSDMVVQSMLNVLRTGTDSYVVNPEFAQARL